MISFRCLFLLAPLCFLPSCDTRDSDDLPPIGEVTDVDPRAQELFAAAQAEEQKGDIDDAIDLYKRTADKFPLATVSPQARFRQAVLLEEEDELLDAFDVYQQVIQRYQSTPLYDQARRKQALVAHAAAEGLIKHSFLGLIKSRLDYKKVVGMLETVRDNAPQAMSAPKAQFAIGELLKRREQPVLAIRAHQKVVDDYSHTNYAPRSQFEIGNILLSSAEDGNQNQANLDRAKHTFEDLIQNYPSSDLAKSAREKVKEIASRDVQRSFDIAVFYDKKGEDASAAFYYQEVVKRTNNGDLHNRAKKRLMELNISETAE